MEQEKHHIVPYKVYFYILIALITPYISCRSELPKLILESTPF